MRAIVYDSAAPRGLRLGEVAEPRPSDAQALVEVRAISLNFGELAFMAGHLQPGEVPGWDAAGVVVRAAPDGSGPAAGSAVVTFGWGGAWAERRAVETGELAVLADSIYLGAASTLPVAGVTALRALRQLGPVIGRRVLVTGASGGVGRYAVQLAARAGAHVLAVVGSAARGEGLRELGAAEIVTGLEQVTEPVFGVLDNVGVPSWRGPSPCWTPAASRSASARRPWSRPPSTSRRSGAGEVAGAWRCSSWVATWPRTSPTSPDCWPLDGSTRRSVGAGRGTRHRTLRMPCSAGTFGGRRCWRSPSSSDRARAPARGTACGFLGPAEPVAVAEVSGEQLRRHRVAHDG